MYTPLNWTTTQRHVAFASFTSWMLDAFDFFILVFVLSDLAEWFHASVSDVSIAIMLTLAVRPIGALLFGRMAEKYGRRPILMLNILFFTVFELLSAWSPTFMAFLIFRVMYGVAMGGIWGVASSLAMENHSRSFAWPDVGHFQAGYPAAICSPRLFLASSTVW